jgi:hypothetical protein
MLNLGRCWYRFQRINWHFALEFWNRAYHDRSSIPGCHQFSSSPAIVVLQHPTQPLTRLDLACNTPYLVTRLNDLVVQSLMISLGVIMRDVSVNSPSQRLLAKEDQPRKTFVFETPKIPFEMG